MQPQDTPRPENNTSSGAASNGDTSSNSGESSVQAGENIVNQQEQHKSVNQEEFIKDAEVNTHKANLMKDGLPAEDGDETPTIDKDDNINRAMKRGD